MADLIKKIKIKKQDGTFTDYIPIGAEAQNVSTIDGESVQLKLNKKPYYYNSVADMKADTKLKIGDMAVTLGYYEANDGGGAEYKIVQSSDKYIETLNNNLKAELIIENDIANMKQFGAYADGIHDDSRIFESVINRYFNIYIPEGIYLMQTPVNITNSPVHIFGEPTKTIIKNNSAIVCFVFKHANHNIIEDLSFEILNDGAIALTPSEVENHFTMKNICISTTGEFGPLVSLSKAHNVLIDNVKIMGKNGYGYGIILNSIVNCFISHSTISRCGLGLYIKSAASSSLTSEGIHVEDCLFYQNLTQIYTDNTNTLLEFNISNNIFDFCENYGVRIINTEHLVLSNNYFGINKGECISIWSKVTNSLGHINQLIEGNAFCYYYDNAINSCIKIGENNAIGPMSAIKIINNQALKYKTFIEGYSSGGIISSNTTYGGASNNQFVNLDDSSKWIITNNSNGGIPQYISKSNDNKNLFGEYSSITLQKDTWYEGFFSKNTVVSITMANSNPSTAVNTNIILSKDKNNILSWGTETLDKVYTIFNFIVPAGYYFKINWDPSATNISIQNSQAIEL